MECSKQLDYRVLYTEGVAYEQAGRYLEAQACYQQSAMLGYGRSQFRLGLFFLEGKAQAPDKLQAYTYFSQAARHVHRDQARACFNKALMLEKGDGVVLDLAQACFWYQEALRLGNTDAGPRVDLLTQCLKASSQASMPIALTPLANTPFKRMLYSDLMFHESIGCSAFSKVSRASWRHTEIVAVKQFQTSKRRNSRYFSNGYPSDFSAHFT